MLSFVKDQVLIYVVARVLNVIGMLFKSDRSALNLPDGISAVQIMLIDDYIQYVPNFAHTMHSICKFVNRPFKKLLCTTYAWNSTVCTINNKSKTN